MTDGKELSVFKCVSFVVICGVLLSLAGCKSGGGCQNDGTEFPETVIWWEVQR